MKRNWKNLAAFVLVLALVAAVPGIGAALAAGNPAPDLDRECSLTVRFDEKAYEDLSAEDLVVDLYRVADFDLTPEEAFQRVARYLNGEYGTEEMERTAQRVAAIALSEDGPRRYRASEAVNEEIDGLEPGMYLVVIRGAELRRLSDYMTELDDGTIVTIAKGEEYDYHFLPILVTLPGTVVAKDGTVTYVYDGYIVPKMEQVVPTGDLEIVKTLDGYVPGQQGTFVFQVEAFVGEGRDRVRVYSDVVTITFYKEGQLSVLIEGLPAGAEVIVTEVYSGASYRLTTRSNERRTVIVADEIVTAEFTNVPDDTDRRGGAITNHFAYDKDGWTWIPIPDEP